MEDEYIAGIWRHGRAHRLLWERTGHSKHREIRNGAEWVAPSWSWASTGCIVTWDDYQEWATDIHITLLESHIIGITSDTTGQLRGVRIRLTARIFEVPCTKNKQFGFPERTSRNKNVLEVVLGGKTYLGFLTSDDPEDQSRFFRIRNGLPTSFGQ
jgi:hypothetical protein